MSPSLPSHLPPSPPAAAEPHLGHSRVDLQNLLVAFDLTHADFAGELGGGRAVSLQREGTVQGLLVAAPHLGEGELLRGEKKEREIRNMYTIICICKDKQQQTTKLSVSVLGMGGAKTGSGRRFNQKLLKLIAN